MVTCTVCNKEFSSPQKLGGHISSHNRKKQIKEKTLKLCQYCNTELENGWKLGAHIINCVNNPNRNIIRKNRASAKTGIPLRVSTKEKISATVSNNIRQGNWHLSFSKSRTFEYKGLKFQGLWEVNYAKWLDDNLIKWRRPTEKFAYEFEGKTRYYTPDFYLIDESAYIEIKGYPTDKDFAKWTQFPLYLILVNGFDLCTLGIISNYRKVNREYQGKSWNE